MRFTAAAHESDRMLRVKHLVIQHVSDDAFRHGRLVELPVNQNLAERRIEASELCAPNSLAPPESGLRKAALEISRIDRLKERCKIVMRASWTMLRFPRALLS
jgi:hypothetical protein